jgi:hypothetical protein
MQSEFNLCLVNLNLFQILLDAEMSSVSPQALLMARPNKKNAFISESTFDCCNCSSCIYYNADLTVFMILAAIL